MRIRLFGIRSFTLFAHSAAANSPEHADNHHPVDTSQGRTVQMNQLKIAPLFGMHAHKL
jgi:hypothetical protein